MHLQKLWKHFLQNLSLHVACMHRLFGIFGTRTIINLMSQTSTVMVFSFLTFQGTFSFVIRRLLKCLLIRSLSFSRLFFVKPFIEFHDHFNPFNHMSQFIPSYIIWYFNIFLLILKSLKGRVFRLLGAR